MKLLVQHQQEWMLIVTTRFPSIAKQFNQTLKLERA